MTSPLVWFELHFPRPVQQDEVKMFFRSLANDRRKRLDVIEIVATGGTITYRIGVSRAAGRSLTTLVKSVMPTVTIQRIADATHPAPLQAWSVELVGRTVPLRLDSAEVVGRPLAAALQGAGQDEVAIVQLLLGERLPPRVIEENIGRPRERASHLVEDVLFGQPKLGASRRRAWQEKTGEPGFRAIVRIGISSTDTQRSAALAGNVVAALRNAEAPGVRLKVRRVSAGLVAAAKPGRRWANNVSATELAVLSGMPVGKAPYSAHGHDRSTRLRFNGGTEGDRVVAYSNYPGQSGRSISQSIGDALLHTWLLGPTGSGKSTCLIRMALADASAGRGLVFIDPKGDALNELLARLPAERHGDVVVLDVADPDAVVGFNPLALGDRASEVVVDQMLAAFRNLSHGSWGPRLDLCLSSALMTLVDTKDTNLTALPLLLSNDEFRRKMVTQLQDPVLVDYWRWYDSLTKAERDQVAAPVLSRARSLLLRPRMRAVLGQTTPRFDIGEIFTKCRIFLVSLSEGTLGSEAASLLGTLIIGGLWQRAMERVRLPVSDRVPVVFYMDEWQRLINRHEDFADMLARARSLGIGLTLANQNLSQIVPSSVRSVAMANCRSKVFFQLEHEDAKAVAAGVPQLSPEDLQQLDRFHCYASIANVGAVMPFASGVTMPLSNPINDINHLVRRSKEAFGRPAADVEAEFRSMLSGQSGQASMGPVGRRRRA